MPDLSPREALARTVVAPFFNLIPDAAATSDLAVVLPDRVIGPFRTGREAEEWFLGGAAYDIRPMTTLRSDR